MKTLLQAVKKEEPFRRLRARLRGGESCSAGGLWGSSKALLTAGLVEEVGDRFFLAVCTGRDEAEDFSDDLSDFLGTQTCFFPPWESEPSADVLPSFAILSERLNILLDLDQGWAEPRILVTTVSALLQTVPTPHLLRNARFRIRRGERHPPEAFRGLLGSRGFDRVSMVEQPGEFAQRGGILDIYPLEGGDPLRIEFFGDTVESLRTFDPQTQRSETEIEETGLTLLPIAEFFRGGEWSLIDWLPGGAVLTLVEPDEIGRKVEDVLGRSREGSEAALLKKLQEAPAHHPVLSLRSLPSPSLPDSHDFRVESVQRVRGELKEIVKGIEEIVAEVRRLVLVCRRDAEKQRIEELLVGAGRYPSPKIHLETGRLNSGFLFRDLDAAVLVNREIFQRYRERRVPRRFRRARPIESFLDLRPGDMVVHLTHGIGCFQGLHVMEKEGRHREYLMLQYADGVMLYVPASKIDLVQKYVGAGGIRPRLSRIGGSLWKRKKERVREAVMDLASDLLEIQAARGLEPGIAHPPDDEWQREFEASFPFEDTLDQEEAGKAVKDDLSVPRPMDRLICGDVGYGKTEIAMRGAFKVALGGRQVAMLVPTTILAQQHYRTFKERMADFPIEIQVVSRFKTRGQQEAVLRATREGRVDVLIGTHRLLSPDVKFKDLGLLIIDEEQRFGVEHKERMKKLRRMVDVLTLTATPIPRTLHMALLGIKDISSLTTPPEGRLSIRTIICRFNPERIREAILREVNRDGQVYFVHNRVQSIEVMARRLERLVPEVRIVVGHGQMRERELEARMLRFVEGEVDVLVATTIIESGLDIPRVNTIFINRADRFGLADLHQLRGRVGRYKERAYAYLLLPEKGPVSPVAERRLRAIEEFSELGAGFQIAMRDLEIRGAGNILGREQSGHINMVGYELYCRLLRQTASELKGEPPEPRPGPEVEVDLLVDAYIPGSYIREARHRIEAYRKISRAASTEELADVREELGDRYGDLPLPVQKLMDLVSLKVLLRDAGIRSMACRDRVVLFGVEDRARFEKAFRKVRGRLRWPESGVAHLVLSRKNPPHEIILAELLAILAPPSRQKAK
jgi:transcription-repair coupling factor (superfamily II helicase)